jgi:hypothetical protein
MMGRWIDYKPGHMDLLGEIIGGDVELVELQDQFYGLDGVRQDTLIHEEKVYACTGLALRWPGLAEVWSYPSERVIERPRMYLESMRALLNGYIYELELRRIQTPIRVDETKNQRWIRSLGFKMECLMPKFGRSGEDYFMYSRLA